MTLLQTISSPYSTSQELGDALRRHLAACRRPRKPLGDGDICVIDQRGSIQMYTRKQWADEAYGSDKRKRRCTNCHTKPCQCVKESVDRKGQTHMYRENQMSKTQDSDMEWLDRFAARQQEEADADRYTGEW